MEHRQAVKKRTIAAPQAGRPSNAPHAPARNWRCVRTAVGLWHRVSRVRAGWNRKCCERMSTINWRSDSSPSSCARVSSFRSMSWRRCSAPP